MDLYPFADVALARRLEMAEAHANRAFVQARAANGAPESAWIESAGALAMFDGPDSPCTQTFGLGVLQAPGLTDIERIESFYRERGAPVHHETCPLAHLATASLLADRGYRPTEQSNVLYRPIASVDPPQGGEVVARLIGVGEEQAWIGAAALGCGEIPEAAAFMRDSGPALTTRQGAACFLAELDGRPIAAGALTVHQGVALLAGAATIPAARNRGAQRALLHARLHWAAQQGCDLAMMVTEPGSASQRNAERSQFRIAYTRSKWSRENP